MQERDVIHGFQVTRARKSGELGGTLWEMTHIRTGAELIWLDNGESNKLFSIAFQTLPTDDTGVFHILEHSVLGGSKRFPVKEPFVELLKSSMNTFLNAMTFPDKTVYPVSSRNEQDFLNLVRVYLDAVFCPAIYENPCIFQQEGWHYELREADAEPIYKGVVFNEMKGAFSSLDTRIMDGLKPLLFPDTCYRFESGGDPEKIPDLTYDAFLEKHRSCYHPSNAKIYLDGSVPLERTLALLDGEYLSRYERAEPPCALTYQTPAPAVEAVQYYEIGQEEDESGKAQMALGKVVCRWQDRKKLLALSVLSSYLTGSNDAPLKRAVLQSGLAQDVSFDLEDGIAQPFVVLWVKNMDYARRGELKALLRDAAEALLARGLDRQELEGALNQLEFRLRESEEPKGLIRNFDALSAWLYGGDPMLYLTCGSLFRELRDELDTGYYEALLREVLLENSHTAALYLRPSRTKGAEDRRCEKARLARAKASWSGEQLAEILELNRRLDEWQSQEDTPEALATLPVLPLSEVSPEPEQTETRQLEVGGVPVLFHPVNGRGVVHFSLYFSLADRPAEELSPIAFLTDLLGLLPTRRHTVAELQREIKLNIGSLDYNIAVFSPAGDRSVCRPFFTVSCSALKDRIPAAVELIAEILNETALDSPESPGLIREILVQGDEALRQSVVADGHRFALQRALSHTAAGAAVRERTRGCDLCWWVRRFVQNFDGQIGPFQALARSVQETVFVRDRLTVSVTAPEPCGELEGLIRSLPRTGRPAAADTMAAAVTPPVREAIQIPSGVSYAAAGGYISRYDPAYAGLRVLAAVMTYGYLWNTIRVQGGAYGCGFRVDETGGAGFYSYRDPDPMGSQQVFSAAAEFVRWFCESGEPLDKFIISTVAAEEPLQSPGERGASADRYYFEGVSYEDRVRVRREMLALKKEDLSACCGVLERMAEENARCVVGHAAALEGCETSGWTALKL